MKELGIISVPDTPPPPLSNVKHYLWPYGRSLYAIELEHSALTEREYLEPSRGLYCSCTRARGLRQNDRKYCNTKRLLRASHEQRAYSNTISINFVCTCTTVYAAQHTKVKICLKCQSAMPGLDSRTHTCDTVKIVGFNITRNTKTIYRCTYIYDDVVQEFYTYVSTLSSLIIVPCIRLMYDNYGRSHGGRDMGHRSLTWPFFFF